MRRRAAWRLISALATCSINRITLLLAPLLSSSSPAEIRDYFASRHVLPAVKCGEGRGALGFWQERRRCWGAASREWKQAKWSAWGDDDDDVARYIYGAASI